MKAILSQRVGGEFVPMMRTNLIDIAIRRYFERKRAGEAVRLELKHDSWQELKPLAKLPQYVIEVTQGKYLVDYDAVGGRAYLLTRKKKAAKQFQNYHAAQTYLVGFVAAFGRTDALAIRGIYL